MTLDPNDGRRPSIQVAEAIKRDIANGTYAPGEQIPAVPELAAKYGVAKQTASNALKLLQEEQWVVSRVGSGTFVRTDLDERQPVPNLAELAEQVRQLGERVAILERADASHITNNA